MTEQLERNVDISEQQQQPRLGERTSDIKVINPPLKQTISKEFPSVSQSKGQLSREYNQQMSGSQITGGNQTLGVGQTYTSSQVMGGTEPLGGTQFSAQGQTYRTQGSKLQDYQDIRNTQASVSDDLRETVTETKIRPSEFKTVSSSAANYSQYTVIDKKIIVEKVSETHFENQYVTKTITVPTPILNEITLVTAIEETRRVPVTRLVEVIEQVPIKVVEEVVEYKTIPITKFEEVIEQVPVKKYVPRTEYKKVPVSKLVERTENVSVKKVEERIEYVTITMTNPIKPVPLDSFNEQYSAVIQTQSGLLSSSSQQGMQASAQTNLQGGMQAGFQTGIQGGMQDRSKQVYQKNASATTTNNMNVKTDSLSKEKF
jgi:hypothetical protein